MLVRVPADLLERTAMRCNARRSRKNTMRLRARAARRLDGFSDDGWDPMFASICGVLETNCIAEPTRAA